MALPERIAVNIRSFRIQQKRTQAELAKACSISVKYLSELERGIIPGPSVTVLAKIAEALGITLSDLVREEGQKQSGPTPQDVARLEKLTEDTQANLDKLRAELKAIKKRLRSD
jgi:transcriptional regulator with XRE-family HTH domain